MATKPHQKLAKCHVLFLGNSVPVDNTRGLESVQQPLMKCYPVEHPNEVEGIDSWLTIFTSGVLLQLIGGNKDNQPAPIWFPIQNLFVAAAVKCVSYVDGKGNRYKTEFADINDTQAKLSSHPPLFSMIVKKSTGNRTLQCYSFLVRDERPAVTMVDAAKYAFINESGWSSSHPPEDVIMKELMPTPQDADDIDEFDSVSAAGRQQNQTSPDNDSQKSESEIPLDNQSRTFPANLVKKYTLTYSKHNDSRPNSSRSPRRQPIPEAFQPRYEKHSGGSRAGRYRRDAPPIPVNMIGSLRGTVSTVRQTRDPRTGAAIIERVIIETVPIPVPVPQIIKEYTPIYVPQPPEVRHIETEREVPVPVPVPFYPYDDYHMSHRHGYKTKKGHKSHRKHDAFRDYQIYDEQLRNRAPGANAFFISDVNPNSFGHRQHPPPPPPGYPPYGYPAYGQPPYGPQVYDPGFNRPHESRHQGKHADSSRRRHKSSSSSSSGDDDRGYKKSWNNLKHRSYNNGSVEITELSSAEDRGHGHRKPDVNGNHKMREVDEKMKQFTIRETSSGHNNHAQARDYVQGEFNWSQAQPTDKKKHRDIDERDTRGEPVVDYNQRFGNRSPDGRSYEPQPYQIYRPQEQSKKESKKKDKKNHDKSPERGQQRISSFVVHEPPNEKQYYFKEHTEARPRNWMQADKEFINERAFSSSLAHQPMNGETNAYALNQDDMGETMIDRQMPVPGGIPVMPMGSGGIPVPPPIPATGIPPAGKLNNDAAMY